MRLPAEFIRLPLRIDAERLATEVHAIDPDWWQPHPEGHPGNTALPLVSTDGDPTNEATKGVMLPTRNLAVMPYVRQVMAALGAPIGRSRLMRIEGDAEATVHVDVGYYWFNRVRVHVPILTRPSVTFLCGDRSAHMPAGEAWLFDTTRPHNVLNPGNEQRVHLVIDTVGSTTFWDLVERGDHNPVSAGGAGEIISWEPEVEPQLDFERVNHPVVMPPVELEHVIAVLLEGASGAKRARAAVERAVRDLCHDWRATWAAHGDTDPTAYEPIVQLARTRLQAVAGKVRLPNDQDAARSLISTALGSALNPDLAGGGTPAPPRPPARRNRSTARASTALDRPVFIVSPPRSGSTLLFETLAQSPGLVSIGGESHALMEGIAALHPRSREWASNAVGAGRATPDVVLALRKRFVAAMRDRDGHRPDAGVPTSLLEKTPKNALRVPFLAAAFPEARFVYLYRDPIDTLASMVEGWRSGRFVTYRSLPGWDGPPWSFLLTPGWRELRGLDVPELAARQWSATVETLIGDLEQLDSTRWCVASYGRLIAEPQAEIDRLCAFLDIPWDRPLTAPLPPSKTTLTPPAPDKWKRLEDELHPVLPVIAGASERAREVFASPPGRNRAVEAVKRKPAREPYTKEEIDAGFSSRSTSSFPELLDALSASVVVTTYQTGRIIVVRNDGGQLNTHLRAFDLPMGVAADGNRLVIGTRREVWEYRNQPAVAKKIEPVGSHDACFLPRSCHISGDLRIHDVAIDGDGQIWAVNTLFSCLSTFDDNHSFVPQWQPWFVSALAPEDRCHLNGLAMVEGQPRYVTALGTTDEAGGWRKDKASGGVVIDIEANDIVASGLSMPHSPRWHRGDLWVLESGVGRLARVDLSSGAVETIAEVPGFTRGLSFLGPYAFVGLSQVRETLFEGVPIKDRPDRACGVWVIDIRDGRTVAHLRFEGMIQEIFDVQVLAGIRFPDLVEPSDKRVASSYVLPDTALAGVPPALRG